MKKILRCKLQKKILSLINLTWFDYHNVNVDGAKKISNLLFDPFLLLSIAGVASEARYRELISVDVCGIFKRQNLA